MAEEGLAFLSASLSVLFDKMASAEVADFMHRRKQTEKLSRELKTAMRSVNAVLAEAEEKQLTDPSVKDWVDDLKDVLFDAEDILDEIATESLRRKLEFEFSTTAEKVPDCISNTLPYTFDNEVVPKIEEVLDRLEDLTKEKDFMGLQEVVGVGGKQYPERLPTSYVSESDTFGRDEDKKKVIDLLLPSDVEANERCVIAIVGMGGIGKTTLAKLVYNDSSVEQHFDLKIWFCVSEEFDVPKIKKSIIDQVATSLPCPTFEDPNQLQVTLEKSLNGKNFLLVLDDVWSEKSNHREFLSQLLHYGARGSKILITTRNDSVAFAMHAIATHHLELLPPDDCWSLFEKCAFPNGSSSNADPVKKKKGTQIVNKCKGLPLAIKAIGDLLSESNNVVMWVNILKSNLWDRPLESTGILGSLWLSYAYLPSYLKRCFAYCSIFPKNYIFEKNQLVLLWMAEGFLQQSEIETMEEVGNRYFDALVSRSLFQQSSRVTKSGFVMHDLVNDLANFVTGKFGCTLAGDSSRKMGKMTRYLSCIGRSLYNFWKSEQDLEASQQLRTFLALDLPTGNEIKMPRARFLRVLSLSGRVRIDNSFDSIGKMIHLCYFDISYTYVNRLPNSICELCNLQTLKLSGCPELDILPRDMWKLINLRHLEIDQTDELKEMPIYMGRLKCLQTLTKFVVSKNDSGSHIGELGKLRNLRGNLSIWELQNVKSAKDAFDAGLMDKGYLEELVLQWNPSNEYGVSESQRCVLENLQPHENLKGLTINYYRGTGFPYWIGELPSLSKISQIKLSNCKYCISLPPLGQLPSLIELHIEGFDAVVNVGQEFNVNSSSMKPFASLKFLSFKNMLNWENWFHLGAINKVETFSQLEELYIENCPKLRGWLPVHLPSLAKLEISECQDLEGSLMSLPKDDLRSTLKRLAIKDCKKLELSMHSQYLSLEELFLTNYCDFPPFLLDLFPNLNRIGISECKNLESLEQDEDHLMISDIEIWRCPKFVSFPKGGLRAPYLVKFTLGNCESLRSMPDKMHISLPCLRYLKLVNCPDVESFPEGGLPSNLKQIVISSCKKLTANWKGWDLQILPSLECLEIGGKLEDVESFPGDLFLPTSLTHLNLYLFESLKSMDKEGFQHLTSLVKLVIYDCPKLKYMPEEGFPASLCFLEIDGCPVLEKELRRKGGEEWLKVAPIPNIIIGRRHIQGYGEWPGDQSPHIQGYGEWP